jgi:hypothetical protein
MLSQNYQLSNYLVTDFVGSRDSLGPTATSYGMDDRISIPNKENKKIFLYLGLMHPVALVY